MARPKRLSFLSLTEQEIIHGLPGYTPGGANRAQPASVPASDDGVAITG